MNLLQQSAMAWKEITEYRYLFTYGYKKLEALVHLKESLDNEFNLYSYMPRMYPFMTGIKADYLISSHYSVDNFIFIIKANSQSELKCDFLCCSIFEKGERDYETNQRPRTLMKKERIYIPSSTTDILLDRLAKQAKPANT